MNNQINEIKELEKAVEAAKQKLSLKLKEFNYKTIEVHWDQCSLVMVHPDYTLFADTMINEHGEEWMEHMPEGSVHQ